MTYIVTTDYTIDRIAAPNLPLAPDEWDRRYQDQFANVLRLYFNRLDNFIARLEASSSGAGIQFPNGAFFQDGYTTLTAPMTNNGTTPIQVVSTDGFISSGGLSLTISISGMSSIGSEGGRVSTISISGISGLLMS